MSITHVLISYPTEKTRVYEPYLDTIPIRENTCLWTIYMYFDILTEKYLSMNHILKQYRTEKTFVNEPYLKTIPNRENICQWTISWYYIPIRETLVNKPLTLYLNILKLNLKEKHLSIKYPTEKTFVNETYLILYQSNNCYWNQINVWIL